MPTRMEKSSRSAPAKCSSCNGPMDSPVFCDNCRSLYPPDGLNHFELFGFAPAYDIDLAALRQKYLQVSRGVHPDQHGSAGDPSASVRVSAQLNEAHRVLADPVLRAEYLLELVGGQAAMNDKSVLDGVLANTLMLREEVAEAQGNHDEAALAECRARARATYDATLRRITELAHGLPGEEPLRRELRATLNSIKYYQKLLAGP